MALTFDDFKQKVSIIDVAVYLGYKFDRTKGLNQPSFVLTDGKGNATDRIYIKNPKDSAKQGYWRRGVSASGNQKGDLIGFVRENLDKFPEANNARNEIDGINKVLLSFSNSPATTEDIMKEYADINQIYSAKSFNIDRYEREKNNIDYLMKFFDKRNISRETVETFSNFIEVIRDKESKYNYRNVGFPYTIAGNNNNIVGYEVRGLSNFKGKAEGSDSMKGAWIADFCKHKTDARSIYFGESAYDIMAFYQINKAKINLESSVFVSTGGSFSDYQLKTITDHYSGKPILCFDNDMNGIMYDIKAYCLLQDKTLQSSINGDKITFSVNDRAFEIESSKLSLTSFLAQANMQKGNVLDVMKSPKDSKDWNDVLMKAIDEREIPNRYDFINKQNTFKR